MPEQQVLQYPRWRYHKGLEARLVSTEGEDQSLGDGWADSPAEFEREATAAAIQAEEAMSSDEVPAKPAKRSK